ncbi:ICAM2 protein, partial [Eurystomus gularis]|nr:ICAM2 protein [Eurystomus gularis]
LLNVTTWNTSVLCYYTCNQTRKTVFTKLMVYRAPEPPVLEPVPALEVGMSHELACSVASAAPLRNLTLGLWRGGEMLHTKDFNESSSDEPATVWVRLWLTAERRDDR